LPKFFIRNKCQQDLATGLVGAGEAALVIWPGARKRGQTRTYRVDHGESIVTDLRWFPFRWW